MSNTVFILGAGASQQAGAPLMKDFLDVAYDLWRLKAVGDSERCFQTVFDARAALQAVHSKSQLDLDNIESFFSICEMAKTLDKFPNKNESEIDDLIRALKILIVRTLELTVKFPREGGGFVGPPPYQGFIQLIKQLSDKANPAHSISVVTFNYDIALDYALAVTGFRAEYGLKTQVDVAGRSVPLFKLHGSLNWTEPIKTVAERDIVAWGLGNYLAKHASSWDLENRFLTIPIGSHLHELSKQGHLVTGEPILVPPTWNKADPHHSVGRVWKGAAEALSCAENIFVVGYSMPHTDSFFRYLYALGTLGQVLLKRFWVFDIDKSGEVKRRFEELLGPGAKARFQYFELPFSQGIQVLLQTFLANG